MGSCTLGRRGAWFLNRGCSGNLNSYVNQIPRARLQGRNTDLSVPLSMLGKGSMDETNWFAESIQNGKQGRVMDGEYAEENARRKRCCSPAKSVGWR